MVSKYDVFYVISSSGELQVSQIVEQLGKSKKEYQNIFNNVLELEKNGLVKRERKVKIIHNKKAIDLFKLISFCINNSMNYNLLFKENMLAFLEKASKKENFIIKDIYIHPQTFNLYVSALSKYGFLLILSRKPLKCKLLRHHFLNELLEYFDKKSSFYNPTQIDFNPLIKKELLKYKRNLKINYNFIEEIETKEKTGFIYTSLHLEGNPLTLPETQKLILDDIVPSKYKLIQIKEVSNYNKAVDLMFSNTKKKVKLDLQLILNYYKLAMQHISGAGEIRKQNVRIPKNPKFLTSKWEIIPTKLNNLLKKYDEFENKKKKTIEEIITFAAHFHNEFQKIHPFIDGNGRISRLLMWHILRKNGLPVVDLPIGYFDLYLDLTKRSSKRDDKSLTYLVEEFVYINLKRLNNII